MVDARDPSIRLEKWDRVVHGVGEPEGLIEELASLEHKIHIEDLAPPELEPAKDEFKIEAYTRLLTEYDRLIEYKKAIGVLIDLLENKSYALYFADEPPGEEEKSLRIKKVYEYTRAIEGVFERRGYEVRHRSRKKVIEDMVNRKSYYVLIPAKITKSEVLEVAQRGEVFPPKSTRFVLPVRVLYMNIPIKLLKKSKWVDTLLGADPLKARNDIVESILRERKLTKIPGNIDLDRHYDEPYIYIFE
jgi:hypothetical protein